MKSKKTRYLVKGRDRRLFLKIVKIVFIEMVGYNRVAVHMIDKVIFENRDTMKSLLTKMRDYNFLRIHNGVLVNMDYAHGISSETNFQAAGGKLIMDDEMNLPISRNRHKVVLKYLNNRSM